MKTNNRTNKTALITGASSGIGKALARIHAEHGGNLIITARREDELNKLKADLESTHNINVTCITCDLSQPSAAQSLFEQIKSTEIQVDYLINNAGFGQVGSFHELSLERQQQMMHLNMVSLTELMHVFIPEMIARNDGKILNTSSTASLIAGPNQAVYFATKAYVSSLTNAIAKELEKTNITVTNLMPGPTITEFGSISDMDKTKLFSKPASARSVAEDGYNAMLLGKLDVISGLPFTTRILLKLAPLLPKSFSLKQVYDSQQVKQ